MNKIILDILGRQHNLNIMFCGAGYSKNVSEKTGKKIVFGKGLLDETLELMNSVSWKHWDKGNKHDKHNMVTECIDAIHFLNAVFLQDVINVDYRKDLILDTVFADRVVDKYQFLLETRGGMLIPSSVKNDSDDLDILIILLSKVATNSMHYRCKNLYGVIENVPSDSRFIDDIIVAYAYVLYYLNVELGITPELMHKKYIIKNVLNKFRQNNGYKEGIYKKIWKIGEDNLEDNDVVFMHFKDIDLSIAKNCVDDYIYGVISNLYLQQVKGKK